MVAFVVKHGVKESYENNSSVNRQKNARHSSLHIVLSGHSCRKNCCKVDQREFRASSWGVSDLTENIYDTVISTKSTRTSDSVSEVGKETIGRQLEGISRPNFNCYTYFQIWRKWKKLCIDRAEMTKKCGRPLQRGFLFIKKFCPLRRNFLSSLTCKASIIK